MKNWLPVVAAAPALAGCTREKAAVAGPQPAPAGKEVTLSAKMQSEGGVVVEAVAARALPQTLRASGRITVNENRT